MYGLSLEAEQWEARATQGHCQVMRGSRGSCLEDKDVIQHEAEGAAAVLAQGRLAHGRVRGHMVQRSCLGNARCGPSVQNPDIHTIQVRRVWRPELRLFYWHLQLI